MYPQNNSRHERLNLFLHFFSVLISLASCLERIADPCPLLMEVLDIWWAHFSDLEEHVISCMDENELKPETPGVVSHTGTGAAGMSCNKTCLVGLLIRSIFRGKIARALQCEWSFSSEKSNEITDRQDIFCFNHASTFYMSKSIEKKCWLIKKNRGTNSHRKSYRKSTLLCFSVTCFKHVM